MEDALIKIEQVELIPETHKEAPISDFSSLGAAGSSLHQFVQSIARPGGEGIYKVTFPKGFSDMTLSKFKNENVFMGSGITGRSFKQARLTQIPANPTQVFIAMALINIQNKLNEINEMQHEMLDFMYDVEEAKLMGNLSDLNKLVDDYKRNSDNQTFLNHMLDQVGSIKNDASKSEHLYKKKIQDILETEDSFHGTRKANDQVNKLRRFLRNYHLAFYIRSYTEFLEIFLIKNFSEANLTHVRERFITEKAAYDELYANCYEWSKKYLGTAIDRKTSSFFKKWDDLYAKAASHLPGHFERYFSADAEKHVSVNTQMERISQDKEGGTTAFVESIKRIERLQNQPVIMYLKGDNIYIESGKEE